MTEHTGQWFAAIALTTALILAAAPASAKIGTGDSFSNARPLAQIAKNDKANKGKKGEKGKAGEQTKCPGGRDKDGNCKGYQGSGSKEKGKGADNIGTGKNKKK